MEWWYVLGLTLRQFNAYQNRHALGTKRRDSMLEVMVGQLIAMVANTGYRSFKEPRRANEFMPSMWKADKAVIAPKRLKRITSTDRARIVKEAREMMRKARTGR